MVESEREKKSHHLGEWISANVIPCDVWDMSSDPEDPKDMNDAVRGMGSGVVCGVMWMCGWMSSGACSVLDVSSNSFVSCLGGGGKL